MSAFLLRRGVTLPVGNNNPNGAISINAAGRLVNNVGSPLMLRGMNLPGLELSLASGLLNGGFWNYNPWGDSSTDNSGSVPVSGHSYPAIATWNPNFIRYMVNGNSFCNVTCATLTDPSGVGTVSSAAFTVGTATVADPQSVYKPAIIQAVLQARAIGCFMSFDYHCGSPKFTAPGNSTTYFLSGAGQPPFLPYDSAYPYWCDSTQSLPAFIATNFASAAFNAANGFNGGAAGAYHDPNHGGISGIDDIIFELFNEPYLTDQAWTLTQLGTGGVDSGTLAPNTPGATWSPYVPNVEYVMLNGGYCNWYYDQNAGAIPSTFTNPANTNTPVNAAGTIGGGALAIKWRILGYQQIVTALRAQGFTNIISCNSTNFSSTVSSFPYICPVDPLNKIATALHNYPSTYNSASATPGSGDQQATWHYSLDQMIAGTLPYTAPSWTTGWSTGRSVPILNNEFGDVSGPGTAYSFTLGSAPANGATSVTLAVAWPKPTASYIVLFSNGNLRVMTLTNGSTASGTFTALSSSATTAVSVPAVLSSSNPTNLITAYADAAPLGSYHVAAFNWAGPDTATSYSYDGNSGNAPGQTWVLSAFGTVYSITAGVTGTTMTVTAISGGGTPLLAGMQMLSGYNLSTAPTYQTNPGTWIAKQLTSTETGGTLGGRGTYQVSVSQSVTAGSTITLAFPSAWNGYGSTFYNWIQPHA